jgi:trimethylamine--corrinoid protein Co-methyltransferase
MQKEYFYPAVADRYSPKEWAEKGKPDLLGKAIEEKKRILSSYFPRHVPRALDEALRQRFQNIYLPRPAG